MPAPFIKQFLLWTETQKNTYEGKQKSHLDKEYAFIRASRKGIELEQVCPCFP